MKGDRRRKEDEGGRRKEEGGRRKEEGPRLNTNNHSQRFGKNSRNIQKIREFVENKSRSLVVSKIINGGAVLLYLQLMYRATPPWAVFVGTGIGGRFSVRSFVVRVCRSKMALAFDTKT